MSSDGEDILVATSTHIHADDMVLGQLWRDLHHVGQRVGRLQRRYDPLSLTTQLKRLQCLCVGDDEKNDTSCANGCPCR